MKTMFLCLFLLLGSSTGEPDSLRVLFWNVENFFDWRVDSTSTSELSFSSRGERHWTKRRFKAKSNAIAKTILWAEVPDVIGLAEVENRFVLRRLLEDTALRKLDYKPVHFDSPDRRGIDVALLYRSGRLELTEARPCHIYSADSSVMATRDILLAVFRPTEGGDPVAFLVNHHPSKYGGTEESEVRRGRAVGRLKDLADSLRAAGITRIVAMGDMNDTPANPVYKTLDLVNLAEPLYRKGEGTIRFEGDWELIDMFFVSPQAGAGPMQILHPPFLTVPDKTHGGTKPLRTYSGPRYLGGVSDHRPIAIKIVYL